MLVLTEVTDGSVNQTSKWHIPPNVWLGHLGTGWCHLLRGVWFWQKQVQAWIWFIGPNYGWGERWSIIGSSLTKSWACGWAVLGLPCRHACGARHSAGAYRVAFIPMSAVFMVFMHFISQVAWDDMLLPLSLDSTLPFPQIYLSVFSAFYG